MVNTGKPEGASVILTWPPKELSPNSRAHWAAKAKCAKAYRMAARVAARTIKPAGDAITLTITFRPPDSRPRDLDNMLSSIKSGLDGIADGLGVNDKHFRLTIERGEPVKHGAVIVCID